ncbi:LOW QUALITY PROTEIN: hypothetical protein GQ55_1G311200 [Panicum hallii var. hallii]|uniref:Protein phosphatase n=1 Tax=Panicum hallii var. hallii TaxID=1504633 RepID=A0A2T7F9D5_9POAL|nr:LOW QUALITY PROTEIN: hypothetical protein GQ55_1G311200 [Panicum hallii var. hallii]
MPVMEKLERRMRQVLFKVDERVARISKMPVVEKSKKMLRKLIEVDGRDSKKAEKPVVKLLQRVRRTLGKRTETEASGTVRAEPEGGGRSSTEELDGGGDRPRELDVAVPRARALWMDMASCYIPDHDEDAFFCHPGAGASGVADGVGSYRRKGLDAGAFARTLIANAFAEAGRAFAEGGTSVCPYTLLRGAYEAAARSLAPGASTAVIVSLDGATLKWACVGDSAFAVLRGGRIVRRSKPQQHHFNCPYQLSANDADVGGMPVMDGDVVVIGTDGLFDNVFDVELEQLVRRGTVLGPSSQNMADNIAGAACDMSFGWLAHSPSTSSSKLEERRERRGAIYGGKVDDITVVVAFIVSSI